MELIDKIYNLSKQFLPGGRAFKFPDSGPGSQLFYALSLSEERAMKDALSILDSAIPDNENFTSEDALMWEQRLGLIYSAGATLEERKAAILRKMNFPGRVNARQSALWIENQLRLAGFDVYVHENLSALSPESLYSTSSLFSVEHGVFQHGEHEHGNLSSFICANHIDESLDSYFDWGSNLKCSFFVSGQNIGDIANVPDVRKKEFRQIILRTKPAQMVAFLMVNYI